MSRRGEQAELIVFALLPPPVPRDALDEPRLLGREPAQPRRRAAQLCLAILLLHPLYLVLLLQLLDSAILLLHPHDDRNNP